MSRGPVSKRLVVHNYMIRTSSIYFHLSWIGWTLTSVLFMIEPEMSAIPLVAFISLVLGLLLCLSNPLLSLYLLPFAMMLGPVFVLRIEGVGVMTVGDLYALILILRTLLLHPVYPKKMTGMIGLLACVFCLILSAFSSINVAASIVGLTKLLQYGLLYWTTTVLIKQREDLHKLFSAWVFITTLCSIIMLWHFYAGRPPMINILLDSINEVVIDLERADLLFRPNYFYANFFIPMGLSVLYALLSVMMRIETKRFNRVVIGLTLPINLFALLMNNTRAMLLPVLLLCGSILLWYCWKSFKKSKRSLIGLAVLVFITIVATKFFAWLLVAESQSFALLDRFADYESVFLRFSIWASALSKVFENPFRLLVGWGPQSTARQLETSYMQDLLTGTLGNVEGAFDSTIVGLVVEYGIVFAILVIAYITLWFSRTWAYLKATGDTMAFAMLVMSAALLLAHFFQQFGLSPAALMALQLFGFLSVLRRSRRAVA
jgi:hypothetical protein